MKIPVLSSWWLDTKLGIRMLGKYPGLTISGVAGIAVAVAIAAGGFSVIYDNFLTSALPLEEGSRVVSMHLWDSSTRQVEGRALYDFHRWREELKTVREVSAFRALTPNLISATAPPEGVRVAAMTASGFALARVEPLLGRYLSEEDERAGAAPVVVIGESVWRSRFASDPAILGRTIQIGSIHYAVAGVMPKGFAFPVNHQFWVPLATGIAPAEPRTGPQLQVFGRLAPQATLEQAQAELSSIGLRTAKAFGKSYAGLRPQASAYAHNMLGIRGGDDMAGLLATQGLVMSLLVLVCLNVAILVYTRTAMRQAEIGLRMALGAGRGRIVAQLFVEALVLSAVAAVAGISIAAFALRQVARAIEPIAAELPYWISFRLPPEAVFYAGALSVLAAMIVSVVPALQATARHAQTGLRVVGAGDSGPRLGKTWTILIVAQVAFGVAILPPAVFGAWDTARAALASPGFAASQFVSAQLGADSSGDTKGLAGQTELLRRLKQDPQVSAVTFALALPGDEPGARVEVQAETSGETYEVRFNRVDVDFFRTFAVPVLAGRDLASQDTVVVNDVFSRKIFGSGNALGRRIRYIDAQGSGEDRWYEIAGVVRNFPTGVSAGMQDGELKVYHPIAPGQIQPVALAIKMRSGAPGAFSPRLRGIAAAVDPDLYLRNIRSLEENLRREQWIRRLEAGVLVAVTVSVLLLCSAGIYALMTFTVSQRRREIGIRMALGASGQRIVASIFSRALAQLSAGAALGVAVGLLMEKLSDGNLMQGHAAVVMPVVALVIMMVGFLAAAGPVRRSLRIEPTKVLRDQ